MFQIIWRESGLRHGIVRLTLIFSVLSLVYFGCYTIASIFLGKVLNDAVTVLVFWLLNLGSTYVYMRFFFIFLAQLRDERKVLPFRACLPIFAVETILFALAILIYYGFYLPQLLIVCMLLSYLYLFVCVIFQLYCFCEIYDGNRSVFAILKNSAIRLWKDKKQAFLACIGLAFGYLSLHLLFMGLQMTVLYMLPEAAILYIGQTMNQWVELGMIAVTLITQDMLGAMLPYLLFQIVGALLYSVFYVIYLMWVCCIREGRLHAKR